MTIFALLNLILYFFVCYKAVAYFHGPCASRRDTDKVVVGGIGFLSAVFVLLQLSILASQPEILGRAKSGMVTSLYMFCAANGVLYLAIMGALSRTPHEGGVCRTSKRYFP